MLLRTVVRDCLYVNWAVPCDRLPPLPESLRYELHSVAGVRYGFVSGLLFRQSGLRLAAMPWARLSYPQLNVRLYVADEEGVPSVLFKALIVPRWVVPLAQVAGQSGLVRGRFDYPRPSRDTGAQGWTWRAKARGLLEVASRQSEPKRGEGPDLGSWQRTCDYFRRRDRGYLSVGAGSYKNKTSHSVTVVWPMSVDVLQDSLLRRLIGGAHESDWPAIHSAWLCPEIPLSFELGGAVKGVMPSRVPAPG